MIWIRADANETMGSGHVMRCLSIAAALRKMGEKVCFLAADEKTVPLLEAGGQAYHVLHTDYTRMEEELEILEGMLASCAPDFFLADSYFVTAEYFRRVRRRVPVGYVDDRCVKGLPLDLLINYNIFAEESLYGQQDGTRLLLGTAYAPLREEFRGTQYQVRQDALRVLVTTGGSDRYQLAGRFLEKALGDDRTAGLEYGIVSGAFNPYLKELREWEKKNGNVRIYSNVTNMRELMEKSDIAVSAGGSTMYELSAVGVPTLCFSFVDNQEEIVRGFVDQGLVCFGGNYLAQGEGMLEMLVEKMALLVSDRRLRQAYSEKQRQMVDGKGAERIAQALLQGK